ncbi:MAG: histidine phosphatase family protein [Betaproteobacteria bacterium]|nr:MAG: histidine phosphatase family protein [Betaproteobacteria bacterium]
MAKQKRILLVRHGETDWNRTERIQGMEDIPLNALGLAQAEAVAIEIAKWVRGDAALVCSDLVRTRETAKPIIETTGLAVRYDARLRERHFGVLQGKTYTEWREMDAEGARRHAEGDQDYGPEGGETAREFYLRCVNAITDLAIACDEPTLLIVTHGGVVSSMYRHSQGIGAMGARTWSVPNCSISEWRFDGANFYCDRIGDDTFLQEALDEVDAK